MEKKKAGRPKKEGADKTVTLNLRLKESEREYLRSITKREGNISDTDTIRRWIRAAKK